MPDLAGFGDWTTDWLDCHAKFEVNSVKNFMSRSLKIGSDCLSIDPINHVDLDPDLSLRYLNGTVPIESSLYLERVLFEAQIEREICKPGEL